MTAAACLYTFIYDASPGERSRSLVSNNQLLELADRESTYLICEGVWQPRPEVMKTRQLPHTHKPEQGPVNYLHC